MFLFNSNEDYVAKNKMVKRNTTLRSFINNESTKGGLGARDENIVLSRKNDTLEQGKIMMRVAGIM